MSHFDWLDVSYFQAKFGKERVKANKDCHALMIPLGGGLALWPHRTIAL